VTVVEILIPLAALGPLFAAFTTTAESL